MSGSDCDGGEISRVGGRGGDEKPIEDMTRSKNTSTNNKKVNKRPGGIGIRCCFPKNLAKAKQAAAVTKKKAEKTESRRPSSSSCSPGKCIGFKHCCDGFNKPSPPPPPPIPAASQQSSSLSTAASDPNGPDFTSDMLGVLIQRNDFYCRECNPHSAYLTTNPT